MPLPQLRYAQVVKSYRRRRLVGVKHRVVFGTMERVTQVLSACGWQINTAFVERLNLDIRQRGGCSRPTGQHAMHGRGPLGTATGGVPELPQLLSAPCQLTDTSETSRTYQRCRLGQAVAALHTGDGRWVDRSCLELP
jgi:hypothetical protein